MSSIGAENVGRRVARPEQECADRLSEVLQDLRLAKASYCRSELSAPWGIEMPFQEGVRFHAVAEGRCWMLTAAHAPIQLERGDVILLPHGTGHVIADDPSRRPVSLWQAGPRLVGNSTYRLTAGGDGARSLIVCCTIGFEGPTAHPLVQLLPDILHIRRTDLRDPSLPTLLGMMVDEAATLRIGSATVMARLADIVVTRIIRNWVEDRPSELTGWLAAIRDPQIGVALAGIHRRPGNEWNVEALAALSGLSRSKFSERFSRVLGVSPARYLLQWRMSLAAAWLRSTAMTVSEAALQLGYESEASFSRAFKRFMGVSPGAVRLGAR